MAFGELLKELRAGAGLSLGQLARQVGLSAAYLLDLERGARKPPPLKVVLILARALGADPYPLALQAARERGAVEIPLSDGVDPGAAVRLALRLLEEADHGCADPDR
jgi:transcriptional regulator with XRE-family HTH domain